MKKPQHKVAERLDPGLYEIFEYIKKRSFDEGILPPKTKILIALALDAFAGSVGGVRSLANAAIEAGANKVEIGEAIRIAMYVGAAQPFYTIGNGLAEFVETLEE